MTQVDFTNQSLYKVILTYDYFYEFNEKNL